MTDRELLQSYHLHRKEDAFRTLVDRYVGLVHASALRQTASESVAEEVTQAVFILLARKAARLGGREVLAGWLLKTTRFVALKAMRGEARRKRREEEAMSTYTQTTVDESWRMMSPLLDEAIASLGETDRNAVVLHYQQGKSLREVSATIGVSEDAAKKRVARAVGKLKGFFSRRGCALGLTAIGGALTTHSVVAAPASLSAGVTAVALTKGGAAVPLLPLLVRDTLAAWRWTRAKWIGIAGGAVMLAGLSLLPRSFSARPTPEANNVAEGSQAKAAVGLVQAGEPTIALPKIPASTTTKTTGQSLRLSVVDETSGKPIVDAAVHVRYWRKEGLDYRDDLRTDASGQCQVSIAGNPLGRLDIGAVQQGHVPKVFTWRDLPTFGPLPAEHILKLEPAVTVGGQVVDPLGIPVNSATIRLQFSGGGDSTAREPHHGYTGFVDHELTVAQTDADGRWSFALLPKQPVEAYIRVQHIAFRKTGYSIGTSPVANDSLPVWQSLTNRSAVARLLPALSLSGVVRGSNGNPIPGALLAYGVAGDEQKNLPTTDANGIFNLATLNAGPLALLVKADGFAPQVHDLVIAESMPFQDYTLQSGRHLRIQVVDDGHEPVAGARVVLEQWGTRRHLLNWSGSTAADGRTEWSSAPDGKLFITAMAPGYAYAREVELAADGEEHVIPLKSAVTISGTVRNAVTGQPIEHFKVMPGASYGGMPVQNWDRSAVQPGTNGTFRLTYDESQYPLHVRVEAEGYLSSETLALREHAPTANVDLQLRPITSADSFAGQILLPDGAPASGAYVGVVSEQKRLRLFGKTLIGKEPNLVRADGDGRFTLGPDPNAHSIIATHELGFARAALLGADATNLVLHLQPWGRIEGRLVRKLGPKGNQLIKIKDEPSLWLRLELELDRGYWQTRTREDGSFTFGLVPPGILRLYLDDPAAGGQIYHKTIEVASDSVTHVDFGETGITVTGRLQLAKQSNGVDWSRHLLLFGQLRVQHPLQVPVPPGTSDAERPKWRAAWLLSKAGRERMLQPSYWHFHPAADGRIVLNDVQPGVLQLEAALDGKGARELLPGQTINLQLHRSINIPDLTVGNAGAYYDLGTLEFPLASQAANR